jgi:D-alanine-D-alanine ligase-like ATP-grasp enzyme
VGLLQRNGHLEAFPPVENLDNPPKSKSELIVFNRPFSYKPGDVPERLKTELETISRQVFAVSRAKGYARVDFMISDEDERPFVLEINAVPGLKRESFFPYGAFLQGIMEDELMETIVRDAVLEEK